MPASLSDECVGQAYWSFCKLPLMGMAGALDTFASQACPYQFSLCDNLLIILLALVSLAPGPRACSCPRSALPSCHEAMFGLEDCKGQHHPCYLQLHT